MQPIQPHNATFWRAINATTNPKIPTFSSIPAVDTIYSNDQNARYRQELPTTWPILICLLGRFRVLKAGHPFTLHGPKAEALLFSLALQYEHGIQRDALLNLLWPDCDPGLASQSLNSLAHTLKKLLCDEIGGAVPILNEHGHYRLNVEAGISVDVICFEQLVALGDYQSRAGNRPAATDAYIQAASLYHGELCAWVNATPSASASACGVTTADLHVVIEREHLQATYLSLLARLADYYRTIGDYQACLDSAHRILAIDPCREDAHRMLMLCYVGRGERSQALRQYRLCEDILHFEFDAEPEPATLALFNHVRESPSSVYVDYA